eukprot:1558582-Amphidinium_carterae.2
MHKRFLWRAFALSTCEEALLTPPPLLCMVAGRFGQVGLQQRATQTPFPGGRGAVLLSIEISASSLLAAASKCINDTASQAPLACPFGSFANLIALARPRQ